MTNPILSIASDIEFLVTIPVTMPSNLSTSYIQNNFPNMFKKVKKKLCFFNLSSAPVFKLRLADRQLEMTFPMPLVASPLKVIEKAVKEVNMMTIRDAYIKRAILSLNGVNITAILAATPATVVQVPATLNNTATV
jgi:hypothetical protein